MKTTYDDKCKIFNTNTEKSAEVDILNFVPQKKLVVSVQKSVKVTLAWDDKHHIYVGSMGGMEFTSEGPRGYTVKDGRR